MYSKQDQGNEGKEQVIKEGAKKKKSSTTSNPAVCFDQSSPAQSSPVYSFDWPNHPFD